MTAPAFAQDNARMIERLRAADTNHDGAVSRGEFVSFRAQQFSRLDRNQDGFISEDDAPRFAARRMGANGLSPQQLQAAFDVNHDGRVSQSEFVGGPTPVFDRVDANANGLATEAEFDAALARARAQGS
jgi:Ca2+-binding EF-hand superfamily protein